MQNKSSSRYSEESDKENAAPMEDGSEAIHPQSFQNLSDRFWFEHDFQQCLDTMEKVQPILAAAAMLRKAQNNISTSAVIEDAGERQETPQRGQNRSNLGASSSWASARYLREWKATKLSANLEENDWSDSDTDWIANRRQARQTRKHTRGNLRKRRGGVSAKSSRARVPTKIPVKQKKTDSSSSGSENRIPLEHDQKNLSIIQRAWIGKMVGQKKQEKKHFREKPKRPPTKITAKQKQTRSISSDWESDWETESEPSTLPNSNQAKQNLKQIPPNLSDNSGETSTNYNRMELESGNSVNQKQSDSSSSDSRCQVYTRSRWAKLTGTSKVPEPSREQHICKKDAAGRYLCQYRKCTATFAQSWNFLRHSEMVHNQPIFYCIYCNTEYDTATAYKNHQDNCRYSRKYSRNCKFCSSCWMTKPGLLKHEHSCPARPN